MHEDHPGTLPWSAQRNSIRVQRLEVLVLDGAQAGLRHTAGDDVLTVGSATSNDLVIDDATVSRFHLELRRREDGVLVTDVGSTNGVYLGATRIERAIVLPGTELSIGRVHIRIDDGAAGDVDAVVGDSLGPLRGRTDSMRRLMARVKKASASDAPVLLIGDSGTGKELIARALHEEGARAGKPFVIVDCASLSPTLVASELFGHERGAFTGADRRHEGAFERARGGTLVLDEIGELPETLQPVLLGVLERRKFRRLGGREEIAVDVRVVAATHRDLRAAVNQGRFRLDLYYRLAVVTIQVPALRERLEDVPMLFEHFARDAGYLGPIEQLLTPAMSTTLLRHTWPGNVRELRNFVEATIAMGESPPVGPSDGSSIAPPAGADPVEAALDLPYRSARAAIVSEFELRYVKHWLAKTEGNVTAAARDAAMDRSYLWELIRRHNLRG